jgi:histidinol-phosphate aminotransferase
VTSIGELRRRIIGDLVRPSYSIQSKDMILLNDNANLFGVNPAVEEVAKVFDFSRLWAYPSENSDGLRARIASEFSVSPDEVIIGNGSDDLLDITCRCFLNPGDAMCSPSPTFGMYKFYAKLNLGRVCEKVLAEDFSLNPNLILQENAKLNAICQPNNPTANLFDKSAVSAILAGASGVTILDEAYGDFCGSNMLSDAMSSERTIDIRTFSKAYGMAGLRVGFAISRKEVIDELRRVRTPFGLNSFSEAVAMRAIEDKAWVKEVLAKVKSEAAYLGPRLEKLGFRVYPTSCNFLLCKSPVPGSNLVSSLKNEGVAIRDCGMFPLLDDHVRITLAPRPMLEGLLDKLENLILGGK